MRLCQNFGAPLVHHHPSPKGERERERERRHVTCPLVRPPGGRRDPEHRILSVCQIVQNALKFTRRGARREARSDTPRRCRSWLRFGRNWAHSARRVAWRVRVSGSRLPPEGAGGVRSQVVFGDGKGRQDECPKKRPMSKTPSHVQQIGSGLLQSAGIGARNMAPHLHPSLEPWGGCWGSPAHHDLGAGGVGRLWAVIPRGRSPGSGSERGSTRRLAPQSALRALIAASIGEAGARCCDADVPRAGRRDRLGLQVLSGSACVVSARLVARGASRAFGGGVSAPASWVGRGRVLPLGVGRREVCAWALERGVVCVCMRVRARP